MTGTLCNELIPESLELYEELAHIHPHDVRVDKRKRRIVWNFKHPDDERVVTTK